MTQDHVKAHQDDLHKILNVKESLNCEMDGLAKDIALQHMLSSQKLSFDTTSLGFGTVQYNGIIIGSRLHQSLY